MLVAHIDILFCFQLYFVLVILVSIIPSTREPFALAIAIAWVTRSLVPSSDMGSNRSDGSGKERLRWTQELHYRFEEAVNQLGGPDSKSAVPCTESTSWRKCCDFISGLVAILLTSLNDLVALLFRGYTEGNLEGYGHSWTDNLPCQKSFAGSLSS